MLMIGLKYREQCMTINEIFSFLDSNVPNPRDHVLSIIKFYDMEMAFSITFDLCIHF